MKIKFLGTAANGGLPQLDCRCDNCLVAEKDSKLRRLRSSMLVEVDDKKIVLDCGPDFRQQILNEGLRLQDLDLIVVSHLHFDHVGGLMELSTGKHLEVPVLVSSENRKLLMLKDEIKYLVGAKFARLISETEGRKMGVELFRVPHDPNFPTSAVIVHKGKKQIWYSSDVAKITDRMIKRMKSVDLVVFDATFLNEKVFPAKKLNHITVEESVLRLEKLGKEVIYSHLNHSENPTKMEASLDKLGFRLAKDGISVKI